MTLEKENARLVRGLMIVLPEDIPMVYNEDGTITNTEPIEVHIPEGSRHWNDEIRMEGVLAHVISPAYKGRIEVDVNLDQGGTAHLGIRLDEIPLPEVTLDFGPEITLYFGEDAGNYPCVARCSAHPDWSGPGSLDWAIEQVDIHRRDTGCTATGTLRI
jgi:hypothetical protein